MTSTLRLAIVVWVCVVGCFSRFDVARYRSATVRVVAAKSLALVPLVVSSAPGSQINVETTPRWLDGPRTTAQLQLAERVPAEELVRGRLATALGVATIVSPQDVDRAMDGARPVDLDRAIPDIANRTSADGVVVVSIKNYTARAAGLLNAEVAGDMTIALYAPDGGLAWSLQAHVVRGPAGSNAAPSLDHFLEYAMAKFDGEVRAMATK